MALCPKCHGILNFWNIKAECPYCGVNIPNYDWEATLDADAAKAEISWVKFRKFTGNFKSAVFGNPLRIVRFICTFLPLVTLILPLANYTMNLPFINESASDFTLLDFSMNTLLSVNWGSLLGLISAETLGSPVAMLIFSILLIYLAIVFGVLNFVFVLLKAPSLKAGANIVLCILSTLCFAVSGVLFSVSVSQIGATSAAFINGSVQFGLFVGIALFALNVILNTVVNMGFKKQRLQQAEN
ncbi:MAG: hypothetical protein IJ025_03975 [Clostridia bacterium]|nr:hypothetical protein [Clostridia bacterium]